VKTTVNFLVIYSYIIDSVHTVGYTLCTKTDIKIVTKYSPEIAIAVNSNGIKHNPKTQNRRQISKKFFTHEYTHRTEMKR